MSSATTNLNRNTILSLYNRTKTQKFGNSRGLQLSDVNHKFTNCTFLDAILVDTIVQPLGARVTSLADLGNDKWLYQVEEEGCSLVSRSLVLRPQMDDFDSENNDLYRHLVKCTEVFSVPALIQGLTLTYDSRDSGHRLRLAPGNDFSVHFDDRLKERYNGWQFDYVDNYGLPIRLDSHKGSRVWRTRREGVSALRLDSDLSLTSIEPLNFSDKSSRMAIVSIP